MKSVLAGRNANCFECVFGSSLCCCAVVRPLCEPELTVPPCGRSHMPADKNEAAGDPDVVHRYLLTGMNEAPPVC